MGSLNPRTRRIRLLELRGFLATTGSVKGFVFLTGLERQFAWFLFGTRTLGTMGTGMTVFLGKANREGAQGTEERQIVPMRSRVIARVLSVSA